MRIKQDIHPAALEEKAKSGLATNSAHIRTFHSVRIRCNPCQKRSPQVYYAEQGDPGGEPIVLIHPHADSWFSFSRVPSLLPAR